MAKLKPAIAPPRQPIDLIWAPFTKIETLAKAAGDLGPDRVYVEGYAASVRPDEAGEVFDLDAQKEAFSRWHGNVREQHDLTKAAGTGSVVRFDDLGTFIGATIVDPVAVMKVREGVYRGFSAGGMTLVKAAGTDNRIHIRRAYLTDVSLADAPCNWTDARFSLVKAVGDLEGIQREEQMIKSLWMAGQVGELAASWASLATRVAYNETAEGRPEDLTMLVRFAALTDGLASLLEDWLSHGFDELQADVARIAAQASNTPAIAPA